MPQIYQATEPGTPWRVVFVPSSQWTQTGMNSDYAVRVGKMWYDFARHTFFHRFLGRISAWRIDRQLTNDLKSPHNFPDEPRVLSLVKNEVPSFDIANRDMVVFVYGGSGHTRGDPNWLLIERGQENAFVHEIGHAFCGLGDEYYNPHPAQVSPRYPNLADNQSGSTCQDKWGDMLGLVVHPHPDLAHLSLPTQQIGCVFHRQSYPNWAAPTAGYCIMDKQGNDYPYCPVCQRHVEGLMRRYGDGDIRYTFDSLPDGLKITTPRLLTGNEFLAYGLRASPDPVHYAANLQTQPAVVMAGPNGDTPCLGMVEAGNVNQAVSRNIRLHFDWPLSLVALSFWGASARYHLQAYDGQGQHIRSEYQDAILHTGPFEISLSDPQGRIRMVEFGEDTAITLIREIRYL